MYSEPDRIARSEHVPMFAEDFLRLSAACGGYSHGDSSVGYYTQSPTFLSRSQTPKDCPDQGLRNLNLDAGVPVAVSSGKVHFGGRHCSEFACQTIQSRRFEPILQIVQIANSITYVDSGRYGRPNPSSSVFSCILLILL